MKKIILPTTLKLVIIARVPRPGPAGGGGAYFKRTGRRVAGLSYRLERHRAVWKQAGLCEAAPSLGSALKITAGRSESNRKQ